MWISRTPLRLAIVGLVALVLGPSDARADDKDGWTLDRVLKLLKAREQAVQSVEGLVERLDAEPPTWKTYSLALMDKEEAMDRFYGTKPAEPRKPPHENPTRPIVPEFFMFRKNTSGEVRIDVLTKGDPAPENINWTACFNGKVWEQNTLLRQSGPTVTLDKSLGIPPVLQAVGLGSPFCPKSGNSFPYAVGRPITLHDLLSTVPAEWVAPPRVVKGHDGTDCLEVVAHSKYDSRLAAIEYHAQLRFELDLTRALAPVRLDVTQVYHRGAGKFEEVEMPQGYTMTWSNFTEPVPGCFLAGSTKIVSWTALALPKDGNDYKQAVKDGKPAFTPGGDKAIDFTQTTLKRFPIVDTTMTTTRLRVNHLGAERLCGIEYPAGTIVEDRTTGEVYQLGGVSTAVDAKLKTTLDDPTKRNRDAPSALVASNLTSRNRIWFLVGNVACVVGLAVGYIWYRRRRPAEAVKPEAAPEGAKPEAAKPEEVKPGGNPAVTPGA
jgi:hypothetical protein